MLVGGSTVHRAHAARRAGALLRSVAGARLCRWMAAALLLAACARPSAALEERGRWKRGCRGGAGGGGGGAAFVGGGVALGEMSELAQNGAGQDTGGSVESGGGADGGGQQLSLSGGAGGRGTGAGPRAQSPARYCRLFLRATRREAAVDCGLFVLPGRAAWGLKTGVFFSLWIGASYVWNLANARALRALRLPVLQATVCAGVGLPAAALRWWWDPQRRPRLALRQVGALLPVAGLHAAGGLASQAAFLHGPLGLAHIHHALEPAFALALHSLAFRRRQRPAVFISLFPAVAAAITAARRAGEGRWVQLGAASAANFCFAARSVAGQGVMRSPAWHRSITLLDGPNTLAVLQAGATLLLLPILLLSEGWRALLPCLHENWISALGTTDTTGVLITEGYLWRQLLLSGLAYQVYYHAAFLTLASVSPAAHSVATHARRLLLVLSSSSLHPPAPAPWLDAGAVSLASLVLHSWVKSVYWRDGLDKSR